MSSDIEDIQRSLANQAEIESICKSCSNFILLEETVNDIKNAQGESITVTLVTKKDFCSILTRNLVFSNLKKTDNCPKGLW